jgi:divalent metal cation (Fe/Co/Zn/Cd) transporter
VRLGWTWVDAASALVVVVLIGHAAWRVLSRSASILVDRAALDAPAVSEVVRKVAGVHDVARVRSRGPADEIHLDLDVHVAAPTTADQSAAIAREIRARLRDAFGGLRDIQVHFLPIHHGPVDYALIARAEADALGLGVHEVIPTVNEHGLTLDMHVEVAPGETVGQAHELVTQFEGRLRAAIPDLHRVVTHIEPAHLSEHPPADSVDAHDLARRALDIANTLYPQGLWHDLDIRGESDGGYALSVHCVVSGDMPLEEAHRLAEIVETRVRAALPAIHRVTIHTEPPDQM